MRKFLFNIILLNCLILSGCTVQQQLDTNYLPVTLGISASFEDLTLFTGGYIGSKDGSSSSIYEGKTMHFQDIRDAFSNSRLFYGMIQSLVVNINTAQNGLQNLYAPFLYNDDTSESIYLSLSSDPSFLTKSPAEGYSDINIFLEQQEFPLTSLIGYDIALHTPGEGSILPILSIDAQGAYQIERAALFRRDILRGYMDMDYIPYLRVLNLEPIKVNIPFTLSNGQEGLVRANLNCDISLESKQDAFIFYITIFADGTLASIDQSLQEKKLPLEQIEQVIASHIRIMCSKTIEQAQNCGTDVFGFTRRILAIDRDGFSDEMLTKIFTQQCEFKFDVQARIDNLSQIR